MHAWYILHAWAKLSEDFSGDLFTPNQTDWKKQRCFIIVASHHGSDASQ